MKVMQRSFMLLMLVLVASCAQLGLPVAKTFEEKLTAGYALNTEVRNTATALLTAKKLSADDGQQILDQTNNARAGLDVARTLGKTDKTAADAKLTAVRTALVALQSYLAAKKGN